jgi:transmembrane sensor
MTKQNTGSAEPKPATVIEFPDNATLADQAALWVSKLDVSEPDRETVAAFKRWYVQSPEHSAMFDKHMALWNDMNVLTGMLPPKREAAPRFGARLLRGWQPALAFCALLLAVGLLFITQMPAHYSTAVGERKTVQLDDGTRVLLNTNTRLQVDYSDQRRRVVLQQGEAHFDIAHNPERPFEVYAGEGLVRALGTAFNVYLKANDVEVVVTEGIVAILPTTEAATELSPATAASTPPTTELAATVVAGNVATYDRHTAEHVMQEALGEADNKLSWHEGMLVFRSEPLAKVIAEINRYTTQKIVIPDRDVRQLKVGGFFKVSDIDSVFDALEKGFDLHAEVVSDDLVYLVHRAK